MKTLEIRRGDRVIIRSRGIVVTGTVIGCPANYGKDGQEDWYVELTTVSGTYHYWKQGIDGGSITNLEDRNE